MGITKQSLVTLERHIERVGGLRGCRMMELGNQCLMLSKEASFWATGTPAKQFFAAEGVTHVSVDINGKDGAVAVDLAQRINRTDWHCAFDVVTDFGTSEHVGKDLVSLWLCRENMHSWCRPGGLLVYVNPMVGSWANHGHHYFTVEHYVKLAEACRYRILEVSEQPLFNDVARTEIHAVMLKQTGEEFIQQWQFNALCHKTVLSA